MNHENAMLIRIATTLSLALLASASFAAESTAADIDAARADGTGNIEISEKFAQLDRNGDGRLTREEAEADYTIGHLYDSFDTSATIEGGTTENSGRGITLEQFEAGMQALASGGVIGPSASGGETILVFPDGTMERVKGTGIQTGN
ncbi:MAG: hypothetical protein CMN27_12205 [Salinisphaera sp.]|nr:hypothetical protein [Salinisphaera sp.]